MPLELQQDWVDQIRVTLPELPDQKKARFIADYGLTNYDAAVLASDYEKADYFEAVAKGRDGKMAVNWVANELFGRLNKEDLSIGESPVSAAHLGELLDLIKSGDISGKIAKTVFDKVWAGEGAPGEIVEKEGLKQVSDTGAIEKIVDDIIAANPSQVEQVQAQKAEGHAKPKALGWFVGQVMKASQGKANPQAVNEILKAKLDL